MIENNELFNELKKVLCKHLYNNDLFYLINKIFDISFIHFWWNPDKMCMCKTNVSVREKKFGKIQIPYMKIKIIAT